MKTLALAAMLTLAAPASAVPRLTDIDIEEHLGARLPLELAFTDEQGRAVKLGDYFGDGKPVLLVLAYFRCPMLCDLVLRGVVDSVTRQSMLLGRDFRALTVSIDPKDRPAAASLKQHGLLQAMNRLDAAAAWPFLVGTQANIATLAERAGVQFAYDAKSDQYAHPACAIVLMPDGRIARYLYGISFRPFDLRLALDEAAKGRIGGIIDRALLACFKYDPATRRYAWAVRGFLRGGAALILLVVGGGLGLLWRRELQRRLDA